jgi:hypothetical protein
MELSEETKTQLLYVIGIIFGLCLCLLLISYYKIRNCQFWNGGNENLETCNTWKKYFVITGIFAGLPLLIGCLIMFMSARNSAGIGYLPM